MSFSVIALSLSAGVAPSLVWLYFWLREDIEHPEPRWLIALSFLGGLLAVLAAIFAEKYVAGIVFDQSRRYIIWAFLEEIFKLIIISVIALNSRFNDEPIDAMIYLITIAIGFAAIENVLFILDPLKNGQILEGVATESMRFVGATLVHIVCSAIIGFSLGFTFYKDRIVKFFSLILGILGAVALHSVFNLSIINASPIQTIKIFAWIWVATLILLILFEEIKAVKPKNLLIKTLNIYHN